MATGKGLESHKRNSDSRGQHRETLWILVGNWAGPELPTGQRVRVWGAELSAPLLASQVDWVLSNASGHPPSAGSMEEGGVKGLWHLTQP